MVRKATTASPLKKTAAVNASEKEVAAEDKTPHEPEKRVYKPKASALTPNTYVTVINGYHGKLVYESKRTGELFIWSEFGDEQDMELQELKSAKNSSKDFFENNWFLIENPEVIAYLGAERYYEHSLKLDEFDELLGKSPEEIESAIQKMPNGQREVLCYRAKQMIADGKIDSIRVINRLEKCLGVELIEREVAN